MALLSCIFVTDHIMRSIIELFYLLVSSSNAVIRNIYCAFAAVSRNADIDFTALFIMIDAVLNEIANRSL